MFPCLLEIKNGGYDYFIIAAYAKRELLGVIFVCATNFVTSISVTLVICFM
jgi:hypothetical protein